MGNIAFKGTSNAGSLDGELFLTQAAMDLTCSMKKSCNGRRRGRGSWLSEVPLSSLEPRRSRSLGQIEKANAVMTTYAIKEPMIATLATRHNVCSVWVGKLYLQPAIKMAAYTAVRPRNIRFAPIGSSRKIVFSKRSTGLVFGANLICNFRKILIQFDQ